MFSHSQIMDRNPECADDYFQWTPDVLLKNPAWLDVMQFTGLRDKNGKEIYEGDIVLYKDFSSGGFISFSGRDIQPRRSLVVEIPDILSGVHLPGFGIITERRISEGIEVIGNRWENPELLGD